MNNPLHSPPWSNPGRAITISRKEEPVMEQCKVTALANQKGGVGKTVSTVNLGVGLARAGHKVLLSEGDFSQNPPRFTAPLPRKTLRYHPCSVSRLKQRRAGWMPMRCFRSWRGCVMTKRSCSGRRLRMPTLKRSRQNGTTFAVSLFTVRKFLPAPRLTHFLTQTGK